LTTYISQAREAPEVQRTLKEVRKIKEASKKVPRTYQRTYRTPHNGQV
jgi:hypothetical protein